MLVSGRNNSKVKVIIFNVKLQDWNSILNLNTCIIYTMFVKQLSFNNNFTFRLREYILCFFPMGDISSYLVNNKMRRKLFHPCKHSNESSSYTSRAFSRVTCVQFPPLWDDRSMEEETYESFIHKKLILKLINWRRKNIEPLANSWQSSRKYYHPLSPIKSRSPL